MTTPSGSMTNWHTTMSSTLGQLTLVRDEAALRGLYFLHHWHMPDTRTFGPPSSKGFADAIREIGEYLEGERREFDLAVAPIGDDSQRRVWERVQEIPYGNTITYGELATRVGNEFTAQQIGAAVGRNPLCVFLPCHRVVGRGGKLTGYAGGIGRKRFLLELEREHASVGERTPMQRTLMSGMW
jgi:methylated-DNA-[protein]-cysteine S-methyltransferase